MVALFSCWLGRVHAVALSHQGVAQWARWHFGHTHTHTQSFVHTWHWAPDTGDLGQRGLPCLGLVLSALALAVL